MEAKVEFFCYIKANAGIRRKMRKIEHLSPRGPGG
jgi:hypothetical protein